jgi:hypothetical protein
MSNILLTHVCMPLSLSLSLCVCVCVCVYVWSASTCVDSIVDHVCGCTGAVHLCKAM